jgi:hypothetical protein
MGRDREAGYKVGVLPAHQFLVRHASAKTTHSGPRAPKTVTETVV